MSHALGKYDGNTCSALDCSALKFSGSGCNDLDHAFSFPSE